MILISFICILSAFLQILWLYDDDAPGYFSVSENKTWDYNEIA